MQNISAGLRTTLVGTAKIVASTFQEARVKLLNMKRKRASTVKSNTVYPFVVTSTGQFVSDMEIETIMLVDAGFEFQ
mgnify:CR=1 FL=1